MRSKQTTKQYSTCNRHPPTYCGVKELNQNKKLLCQSSRVLRHNPQHATTVAAIKPVQLNLHLPLYRSSYLRQLKLLCRLPKTRGHGPTMPKIRNCHMLKLMHNVSVNVNTFLGCIVQCNSEDTADDRTVQLNGLKMNNQFMRQT